MIYGDLIYVMILGNKFNIHKEQKRFLQLDQVTQLKVITETWLSSAEYKKSLRSLMIASFSISHQIYGLRFAQAK